MKCQPFSEILSLFAPLFHFVTSDYVILLIISCYFENLHNLFLLCKILTAESLEASRGT